MRVLYVVQRGLRFAFTLDSSSYLIPEYSTDTHYGTPPSYLVLHTHTDTLERRGRAIGQWVVGHVMRKRGAPSSEWVGRLICVCRASGA